MKSNKRLVIFTDWYLPGVKAGGPIKSISNIVKCLGRELDIYIITSDRDLDSEARYDGIVADQWVKTDHAKIYYCSPENYSKELMQQLLVEVDPKTVYFNSVFSKLYTLIPLSIAKASSYRIILAPRGMLAAGALSVKPLKKKVFIAVSKLIGAFKKVTWHVSSQQEADEVKRAFGKKAVTVIAENLSAKSHPTNPKREKVVGELRLFYLSRVLPIKNLKLALAALQDVEGKVNFDIYGPIEDEAYWKLCQATIATLPENITVSYKGAVSRADNPGEMAKHHFMILPTWSENYGHVIFEAFASGCGVVISNTTPWLKLKNENVGWDLPLDQLEQWTAALNDCVQMTQKEYDLVSNNAFTKAEKIIEDEQIIGRNRRLFNQQ